jgi:ethylmalonyl-CoA/methylmalonyl-CoA decarboxylase
LSDSFNAYLLLDLGVAAQSFLTPKTGSDMSLLMHDTLSRLRRLPFISIAAVSGHAMGGGAELMTSCDLRVVDAGASVRFVQTKMGVVTGWQGMYFIQTQELYSSSHSPVALPLT